MNDPRHTETFAVDGKGRPSDDTSVALPSAIGRYQVEKELGRGGFGLVYLARDEQLQRQVAIKVPHPDRVATSDVADAYLEEARTAANLDHSNIVPVLDVGKTATCPCFIVSKFIDGTDLATQFKRTPFSIRDAVELVATVAEALHYAHQQGIVHRDIKPGNILLDKSGKPFVADFGLALQERDWGKSLQYTGTPAYMSPEQARGEGHRVDGRSDIFSLGIVFYELLVGRQPFRSDSQFELLEQIASLDPRPPRQWDDTIPKEIERICLKSLSKRASDRYTTAKDMANDLKHFLADQSGRVSSSGETRSVATIMRPPLTPGLSSTAASHRALGSENRPIRIVPKGLRSFDSHDADFFLELLPGPRDRDGLPESIRFWKTRIEETDPDNTFPVGLIYGPSGCGKSSLVKAGLLPRLSNAVIVAFVEATAEETETRVLNGLRKRCPGLPDNAGLRETMAALRRTQGVPKDRKVLIILDQFEQWLHAKKSEPNTELVQALRQCDGGKLQCIVMVRDDFWMAATRFMRELEIRLVEGQNSAAVDLFPIRHSEKVLMEFGRAFGVLPEDRSQLNKDQMDFLEQAVVGLAQLDKVVCVRLALFAEMMKGKPWTLTALKEVGGTEGVGVTFLEETFSSATAPPEHRYHQKAARGVLKALLPESGSDIKGHMKSDSELLEASGYAKRPKDFEDLILTLDGETRLITPTDPEGIEVTEDQSPPGRSGQRFYQLTHDYLVPSLGDWLSRKQKQTRKGRAELLLADQAAVWNSRPEKRQLPSLWQWLSILWLTPKNNWTSPQQKMMRSASRLHGIRSAGAISLVVLMIVASMAWRHRVQEQRRADYSAALVKRLLDADIVQIPEIVREIDAYRDHTDPLLRQIIAGPSVDRRSLQAHTPDPDISYPVLYARLALLPKDPSQVDYILDWLLHARPHEVLVIRDAVAPYKADVVDRLWTLVETPEKGKETQQLRAAAALAKFDAKSSKWASSNKLVADLLVAENPVYLGYWMESFRPISDQLLDPLETTYRNSKRRESERSLATSILADYAADQPKVLADLLMDADEKQFSVIFPKLQRQHDQGMPILIAEIVKKLPHDLLSSDPVRETLAKRQANAAVAMLRMDNSAIVWPLLQQSHDPRVRSYLIHRLGSLRADGGAIIKRLDAEKDTSVRRALILCLGEFDLQSFLPLDRQALMTRLQEIYRTESDAGLHASSEWLLRTWNQDAWLTQVNQEWSKNANQRLQRLSQIRKELAIHAKSAVGSPPMAFWYVNTQGQTFAVIPGPVEFLMGSPKTEKERGEREFLQHRRRISRSYAIASKSVTLEEYHRLTRTNYQLDDKNRRFPDLPVVEVNWSLAAKYCNLLSKEEGIPEDQWCYETDASGQVTRSKEGYLSLTGYRLPTESEMEYAARGGSITSRNYGESEELLGYYAWYMKNSDDRLQRVGMKKPNDLGLFDVQGNVYTWCQETFSELPSVKGEIPADDREDTSVINNAIPRALRGGAFADPAAALRASYRASSSPSTVVVYIGFRPVRTIER